MPDVGKGKLGSASMPRKLTVKLNVRLPDSVASEGCLNGAVPGT